MDENEIKQCLGKKCKVYTKNKEIFEGEILKYKMYDYSERDNIYNFIQLITENGCEEIKLLDISKIEILKEVYDD